MTLASIIASRHQTRRAVFFFTALGTIALALAVAARFLVLQPLLDSGRATVSFSSGGGLVLSQRGFTRAQVLVPSSSDWIDTGVHVKAGERVNFQAWGHAHLAINHANQSAIEDKPPLFPWVGPGGEKWEDSRPRDEARRDALLYNNPGNTRIGQIIGAVVPRTKGVKPSIRDARPRPASMFEVGAAASHKPDISGTIWLVVNDVVLGPDAEHSYVGPEVNRNEADSLIERYSAFNSLKDIDKAISKREDREEAWDVVESKAAWDLFYVDNLGTHLVQIEIDH